LIKYPRLFENGFIGPLKLKNRIVMAPMATNFATDSSGVSNLMLEYYHQRAKGGAALITVENANVSFPDGKSGAVQLRIDDDIYIPGLSRLVRRIHQAGSLACSQINHAGGYARVPKGYTPVAASSLPYGAKGIVPQELSVAQIRSLTKKFGQAALRAKRAGFDTIEVHAAHGYLLAEFLSPYMNKRSDGYGGELENRFRFVNEVVTSIRSYVGVDYPLIVRISGEEFLPGGRSIEESVLVAQWLEEMGVDAIHVSAGLQNVEFDRARAALSETMGYQQGWKSYLAGEVKKHVKIPVITVGVIREPEIAEGILAREEADFVALGRTLLADPFWPIKAQKGESHLILRCISCREGCNAQRAYYDRPITCAINPKVGDEDNPYPVPTERRKVAVIGGGPGGMQFALTARDLGHQVDLYEQEKLLGGQLNIACVPPTREKIRWVIEDFEAQLHDKGVAVHINKKLSPKGLSRLNADVVIVATGSNPYLPQQFKGKPNIRDAREIFTTGNFPPKGTIIVAGGGTVGCEAALFVKRSENKVILVEQLEILANDMEPLTRKLFLADLNDSGIMIRTGTKITEVDDHQVTVTSEDRFTKMNFDLLIVAFGSESDQTLFTETAKPFADLYVVGDAAQPGKLLDAVHGGRDLALQVLT